MLSSEDNFQQENYGITNFIFLKIKLVKLISEITYDISPLSANPTKWSNILKQFVGKLPMNCLSVFDHFVKLALKGLLTLSGFERLAISLIY